MFLHWCQVFHLDAPSSSPPHSASTHVWLFYSGCMLRSYVNFSSSQQGYNRKLKHGSQNGTILYEVATGTRWSLQPKCSRILWKLVTQTHLPRVKSLTFLTSTTSKAFCILPISKVPIAHSSTLKAAWGNTTVYSWGVLPISSWHIDKSRFHVYDVLKARFGETPNLTRRRNSIVILNVLAFSSPFPHCNFSFLN